MYRDSRKWSCDKIWGRGYKTVLSTPCSNSMLKPRFHTVLILNVGHQTFWVRYRIQTWARNVQILSMLKTVLNAVLSLRQTKMAAHVEIGRFRYQSSSFLTRCVARFQHPSCLQGVVNPFEEVVNKNDLTGTVLCLKRQYLLNICKLKRHTTTVRYSVAIIMFWWQFFGDGTIRLLLGPWQHKLTANCQTTFPQNCVLSLDE